MWSRSFRYLSDEDVESVVAPPLTLPLPPPQARHPLARGRYLAQVADCAGCHTSWHGHTNPALYGGGNEIVRGKTKAFSTNLTRDPSGIPYYDDALFIEVMRTGHVKARELSPLMPWVVYRNLSDDDLRAIFTFLSAGPRSRTTYRRCGPMALVESRGPSIAALRLRTHSRSSLSMS
jgi:hypothetical protein